LKVKDRLPTLVPAGTRCWGTSRRATRRDGGETPPLERGRPARHNGEAGRDGGETPPLREHRGWCTPRKLPHQALH
jgi:hypothetical protein